MQADYGSTILKTTGALSIKGPEPEGTFEIT